MSYTGLLRPTISISQPLHEPASTSRMCSERPRTLLIRTCNWRPVASMDCPPGAVEDLRGLPSTNLPLGTLETASSPRPSPPEEEREKSAASLRFGGSKRDIVRRIL